MKITHTGLWTTTLSLILVMFLAACGGNKVIPAPYLNVTEQDPGYQHALANCKSNLEENPVPGYFLVGPAVVIAPIAAFMEVNRALCEQAGRNQFRRCMVNHGYPIRFSWEKAEPAKPRKE